MRVLSVEPEAVHFYVFDALSLGAPLAEFLPPEGRILSAMARILYRPELHKTLWAVRV